MGQIVITGASSEIGLAITDKLSSLGKPMLLQCFRNKEALAPWEGKEKIISTDLSDENDLNEFLKELEDTEILVYAAARTDAGLIPHIEPTSMEASIKVNIVAYTRICQAIIPRMCLKRRGIIIGISSVAASRVYKGQGIYSGTKAYMEAFTKAIAAEYSKKGIRSNCVAPGSIEAGAMKRLPFFDKKDLIQINTSGMTGTPSDVAEAVSFLCSEKSSFINGTVLKVDGGHWLGV
jgi:3-oxoacyl-[acyl-carrier protein] reductase